MCAAPPCWMRCSMRIRPPFLAFGFPIGKEEGQVSMSADIIIWRRRKSEYVCRYPVFRLGFAFQVLSIRYCTGMQINAAHVVQQQQQKTVNVRSSMYVFSTIPTTRFSRIGSTNRMGIGILRGLGGSWKSLKYKEWVFHKY